MNASEIEHPFTQLSFGFVLPWAAYNYPIPITQKFFFSFISNIYLSMGLLRWLNGKETPCQCRRLRRRGFDPWVRSISWRRKWPPTPVFLAWKIPWAEEPDGLQSLGLQRLRLDWQTDRAPVYHLFICISIIWTLCICLLLFDWKLFCPILSWSFDSNIFCFLSCLKLHKIF